MSKALVVSGPMRSHYVDLKIPDNLAGGAIGQVLAAGVCGSDLTLYKDGPLGRRLWPLILGHENVVRIVRADENFCSRWGVEIGQRVAIEEFIPCGHCHFCLSGNYRRCRRTDYNSEFFLRYGRTPIAVDPGLWGGFSHYIYIHPDAGVHRLPESIPNLHAPLFVPIANGVRWVSDVGNAKPGDTVVILGPGAHGLGCVIAAREAGAKDIVVIGLSSDTQRLEAARHLGATHTFCADKEDAVEAVGSISGEMADLVIEITAGAPGAARLATELAGPGGRVVIAGGNAASRDGIDPDLVIRNEVQINGVRGHDIRSIIPAIGIMASGRYDLDAITTKSFDLSSAHIALKEFSSSDPNRVVAFVIRPTEEI